MADKNRREIITNQDRDINAIKAGLKLLPGVGDAMIQFIFGKGEEARQRRLQDTLQEVVDKLNERDIEDKLEGNEEFGDFFTKAADPISRSVNEDKRKRFRDLLFNSMQIPPGDPGWEDSMFCLDLLQKIDPAGLYVLAMIAQANRDGKRIGPTSFNALPRWLIVPKDSRGDSQVAADSGEFKDFRYSHVLITKAIALLEGQLRLLWKEQALVSSGGSATGVYFYSLTPDGELLVKWTVADF